MLIFLNPLSPFFYLFTAPFFVLCLAGIVLKCGYLLALEVSIYLTAELIPAVFFALIAWLCCDPLKRFGKTMFNQMMSAITAGERLDRNKQRFLAACRQVLGILPPSFKSPHTSASCCLHSLRFCTSPGLLCPSGLWMCVPACLCLQSEPLPPPLS